jgi:hypothetical protein
VGNGATAATRARYRARPGRPACVITDLSKLHGPTSGVVQLPLRLYWSGPSPSFSLSDEWDRQRLYEIVLREACTTDELATYLNQNMLLQLWSRLYLPTGVKRAWEDCHPTLRSARTAAA